MDLKRLMSEDGEKVIYIGSLIYDEDGSKLRTTILRSCVARDKIYLIPIEFIASETHYHPLAEFPIEYDRFNGRCRAGLEANVTLFDLNFEKSETGLFIPRGIDKVLACTYKAMDYVINEEINRN